MTPERPLVFIVLVNWNGLADTRECLASLSQITYPNARVLVVDNGSQDDQAGTLLSEFPAVTVLATGENLGFTGGNNVGIRHALSSCADYVLCLNNDTVVAPDFLVPLVQALEDDPKAGIAGSKIFYFAEPERAWFLGAECSFDKESARRGGPAWHPLHPERAAWTEPFETQIVTGCALLVRANLIRQLNGFDERYFAYFEDVDLNLRVEKLGLRRLVVPASHVWHKISQSSEGGHSPNITYYISRNTFLLAQTHAPLPERDKYCRFYRRLRERDAWRMAQDRTTAPNVPAHAQAMLSGLLCARLDLYGRRQDHQDAEALVAAQLLKARRWQRLRRASGYESLAHGLMRTYWFINAHVLQRVKVAQP